MKIFQKSFLVQVLLNDMVQELSQLFKIYNIIQSSLKIATTEIALKLASFAACQPMIYDLIYSTTDMSFVILLTSELKGDLIMFD